MYVTWQHGMGLYSYLGDERVSFIDPKSLLHLNILPLSSQSLLNGPSRRKENLLQFVHVLLLLQTF
jgi:hypothetical protein